MTFNDALKIGCISASIVGMINLAGLVYNDANENTRFEYTIDDYGNLNVSGNIKSSVLSDYYLVERKDDNGKLSLCIINKDGLNILTGEFVTSVHEVDGCIVSVDEEIYSIDYMWKYLDDEEDNLFNLDAIRDLLLIISQNFTWHEYKVLSYTYR